MIVFLSITRLIAQKSSSLNKAFSTKDFTISYPESWTIDTSGLMGTQLILFSEQEDDADLFRENVNLVKQNISEYNLGFDEYVKLSESQIQNYITNLDGF
ncbi:MAG: hypothetical protein ACK4GL_03310 [Flavobacteriales bacterium]